MSTDKKKVTRKLRAILSADVKGYSLLMSNDEEFTVETLKAYRTLMSEQIEQQTGRVWLSVCIAKVIGIPDHWVASIPRLAFEGLELCDGKLSRTVLRGLGAGNSPRLPGPQMSLSLDPSAHIMYVSLATPKSHLN